jgi:hypothetical protein
MNSRLPIVLLSAAGALCLLTGCPPKPVTRPTTGPTLPTKEVIRQINARNELLPTLWAAHYYELTIVDDKKQSHFVNGDGALLYRRPDHMLLVGTRPAVGRVFEIGTDGEVYWLKIVPEMDTMWWGKHENIGKPCVEKIPIDPTHVMEVLGVSTFNADLTKLPAPVMRYNDVQDVYMFVWVNKREDRYVAEREVWYDRATLLPTRVILFDDEGRGVLVAALSDHKPVEVPDVSADRWPKVATRYRLFFPESGSKMSFDLTDLRPDKNGVPSRRGIVFPGPTPEDAGVSKVIQLDANCEK